MLRNLLALAVVLALPTAPLAQQADGGRPSFISEADWAQIKPHIDPDHVQWNPYKGLAVKQDGSPYRVLDLRTWMGDDFQVVGFGLLKTQLEAAGVKYTMLSAEFDAPAQARMLEDAIATKSYDAIILHPVDRVAMAAPVEKAIAAGIDVYGWITPVQTPKLTAFAGYKSDEMDANGQIGKYFLDLAQKAGATPDKPFIVLEIWGSRALPICVERYNGVKMGLGDSGIVKVVESVDTGGQPEAQLKAIQDAFAKYPNISGIYPQFGDANATIEGLRSVGRLAPMGDPKHVAVILQDVDKAMLPPVRDGTFDGTVSNGPWQQADVVIKQFLWHTVLKQPLQDGDPLAGKVDLPRKVLVPEPFLTGKTIDTKAGQLWGATIAFTDMPLGKWTYWPTLDTTSIGLPVPTLADRKRLVGY
jgi:ABC-type sugar transport system substrate-binding protein